MRRRLILLAAGAALATGIVAAQQNADPRGDLFSSKAVQALEQCFDSTGVFTCAPSGGGTPVGGSGTSGTVPVWTGSTTLGNSVITNTGINWRFDVATAFGNLALQGGNVFIEGQTDRQITLGFGPNQFGGTRPAMRIQDTLSGTFGFGTPMVELNHSAVAVPSMDGNDTLSYFQIRGSNTTNAHTGTGNIINGINLNITAGAANVTENAVNIASGWDRALAIQAENTPIFFNQTSTPFTATITADGDNEEWRFEYDGDTELVFNYISASGGAGYDFRRDDTSLVHIDETGLALGFGIPIFPFSTEGIQYTATTVAVANASVNAARIYVDEGTNRVGGAPADCVLVARLSTGTEINVAVLVTDAGCP